MSKISLSNQNGKVLTIENHYSSTKDVALSKDKQMIKENFLGSVKGYSINKQVGQYDT